MTIDLILKLFGIRFSLQVDLLCWLSTEYNVLDREDIDIWWYRSGRQELIYVTGHFVKWWWLLLCWLWLCGLCGWTWAGIMEIHETPSYTYTWCTWDVKGSFIQVLKLSIGQFASVTDPLKWHLRNGWWMGTLPVQNPFLCSSKCFGTNVKLCYISILRAGLCLLSRHLYILFEPFAVAMMAELFLWVILTSLS